VQERAQAIQIRRDLMANPYQFSMLKQNDPELAGLVDAEDIDGIVELVRLLPLGLRVWGCG